MSPNPDGCNLLVIKVAIYIMHCENENEKFSFSQCSWNLQDNDAHALYRFINPICTVIFKYQGH